MHQWSSSAGLQDENYKIKMMAIRSFWISVLGKESIFGSYVVTIFFCLMSDESVFSLGRPEMDAWAGPEPGIN